MYRLVRRVSLGSITTLTSRVKLIFEVVARTAKVPQNTGRRSLSARGTPSLARPLLEAASRSLPDSIPLLLRMGVAFCFYGHGTFGLLYKESWVPFFSYFGIYREWARPLELVIGSVDYSVDYLVATLALLIPFPALFAYAAFWGTWTAFLRPLTGLGWWEWFDRAGNFVVALAVLALYVLAGFTNRQWFKPSFPRLDSERKVVVVARVLQVTTALLLLGHAGLAFGQRKALLAHHMETLAGMIGTHDPLQYLLRMSGLIDVALMFAVVCYPASRVFLLGSIGRLRWR